MKELTDFIEAETEYYKDSVGRLFNNLVKNLYNRTLTYLKEEFRKGNENPLYLEVYQLDGDTNNYFFGNSALEDLPYSVVNKFIPYLDEAEEYVVLNKEFFDKLVYLG